MLIVLCVHPVIQRLIAWLPMPAQYGIAALLGIAMLFDFQSTVRVLTDFQKKLDTAAQLLSEKRTVAAEKLYESSVYDTFQKYREELAQRISHQQKRLLAAFPKLKLHHHNELLADIRKVLNERHRVRKGETEGASEPNKFIKAD